VRIENKNFGKWPPWLNYPHAYIGLDGWIVAYYLNTEEASRIMQWNGYSAGTISTTTLKDAIDTICGKTGVSYSTPIKYYDFEFPEANKLTLIAETGSSNTFSVTIPGTLYEGSYSLYTYRPSYSNWGPDTHYPIHLSVDGISVFDSPASSWKSYYGYYNISTHLKVGVPHVISISRVNGGGGATVLIYKN